MSIRKKIVLSATIFVTMLIAVVIGFVGLQPSVKTKTVGTANTGSTQVDKNPGPIIKVEKPKTYTYEAGSVQVKKGSDIISYNYQPSVDSKSGVKTTAYEYIFSSVANKTMAISLKEFKASGVNISYAYSDTELDTSSTITGEATFTAQTVSENKDKYVYILVTPIDENTPAVFNSTVKWNYGKASTITIENNVDGSTITQTVVSGQKMEQPADPVHTSGYNFLGWYLDEDYTIPATFPMNVQGTKLYAKFPNLPTDWVSGSQIIKGTSPLTMTELIIPSTVNGQAITSIKSGSSSTYGVFEDQDNLASAVLPDGLTSIGDYAFAYCNKLTNVVLPSSLRTIGKGAFSSYAGSYINLPEGLITIGEKAFSSCYLESVIIPSTVTSLGGSAFSMSYRLLSVTILSKTITLGSSVFHQCEKLVEVYNLSSASITSSLIKDVYTSLSSPSKLITIDGVVYYKESDTSYIVISLLDDTKTNITLDSRTTEIYRYAFHGGTSNKKLVNVDFPSGLKKIGVYAFWQCTELTSVDLSHCTNLTIINGGAFDLCSNLVKVKLPSSIIEISNGAFEECAFNSIELPEGLKRIGQRAFYECRNLASIKIPSSVTAIESSAFYRCFSLVEVYNLSPNFTITKGGTDNGYVGYYAKNIYTSANADSNLVVIDGVTYYKQTKTNYIAVALADNTKTSIVLDSRTTSIAPSAFYGCKSLINVDLSRCANLTTIGNSAFYDTDIIDIKFPDSLTTIGNTAFNNCDFNHITIPSNVTTIGTDAFKGCAKLFEVYNLSDLPITKGSTKYGYVAYNAVILEDEPKDESKFVTLDGVDYYKNSETDYIALRLSDKSKTSIILDSRTTEIAPGTFQGSVASNIDLSGCTNLIHIQDYAFMNCKDITEIVIPASVEKIGYEAFYDCANLTSITFEDKNIWYSTSSSNYSGGSTFYVTDPVSNASKLTNYSNGAKNYYYHIAKCNVTLNTNGGTFEGTAGATRYTFTSSLQKASDIEITNFTNHEATDNKGFAMDSDGYLVNNNKTGAGDYNYTYSLVKVAFRANAGDIVGFDLTIFSTIYGSVDGSGRIIFSYLDSDFAPNTDLWLDEYPYRSYDAYDYESSYIAEYNIETSGEHYVMIKFVNFGYGGESVAKIKLAKYNRIYDYTKTNLSNMDDCLASDLSSPVRDGYTFIGWFTAAEGGTQVTNVNENMTLYAHWREN